MGRLLRFVSIFVLVFTFAAVADDTTPSFKDILNTTTPGSPVMSPDGSKILFTKSAPNWDKNWYATQIYLIDVASGETRQLTYAENSSSSPAWSPDGRYISFTASRGEKAKRQVYLLPVAGGEARAVTQSKTGVMGYEWSPDGAWIAYSDFDDKEEETKKREDKYGTYEFIEEELDYARLRIVKLDGGETKTLVERNDLHVGGFEWRPDGKAIAFSANPDNRIKSFSKSDIYLVDVESGDITALVQQDGPDSGPVWNPEGTKFAFTTQMGTESYFKNTEIALYDIGSGEITVVTKDFDEDPGSLRWTKMGLTFVAREGMERYLYRIDDSGDIAKVTNNTYSQVYGFSFTKDASSMAFVAYGPENFQEIYVSPVSTYEPRKLTDFGAQTANWQLATKEAISWKSTDGADITGVLIKPANFDPSKKYPLFVVIHGGPTGISTPSLFDGYGRYYPLEQWAAKGAVILEPNYRGSAGFGEAFRSLNYRNLGVGDYWDVISGVDHLISEGFVDPERVCSMGWSQGGYISAFITTFSDRFLAVSVGAGISDWVDYYYRTDITPFTIHYLGDTPWVDPEVYAKTSPMTYINNAQTPTLIQHGSNDARVPINNAYKLYRGLKDTGVEVRFVVYKGFGHGISRPKERLAVLTHNWQWFNRHVWGEEPENDLSEKNDEENEKAKD